MTTALCCFSIGMVNSQWRNPAFSWGRRHYHVLSCLRFIVAIVFPIFSYHIQITLKISETISQLPPIFYAFWSFFLNVVNVARVHGSSTLHGAIASDRTCAITP